MSWGQEDESNLRGRLKKLPQELQDFYWRLREAPTAQLERALQLLAKEVSNGRHETSTATSLSTAAVHPDDNIRWEQITRDLGDLGVTEQMVNEHREFIVDWILRAINDGVLTDEKDAVIAEATAVSLAPVPQTLVPHPMVAPSLPSTSSPPPLSVASSSPPPESQTLPTTYSSSDRYSIPTRSHSLPAPAGASSSTQPQSPTSPAPPPPPKDSAHAPSDYVTDAKPPLPEPPATSEYPPDTKEPLYPPEEPVQPPSAVSPLSSNSYRRTSVLNQFSTINMDAALPPVDTDPAESNIVKNAQKICFHWNGREWKHARENIQAQIACIERGETVLIDGVPQQPNVRILRHLLGINYSLSGEYTKARDVFESLLLGSNLQQLVFDDGDIAAARWLGETCIMLNQLNNAALAWAISYYGLLFKNPPQPPGSRRDRDMLEDLRLLNLRAGGLLSLKVAFTKTNRDASTILMSLSSSQKFTVVSSVLDVIGQYDKGGYTRRRLPPIVSIAEGWLTQPLVAHQSWPLPQDPFFRVESSIELLFALSRPHAPVNTSAINTISLGKSKTLTYVTKNGINWLVEAIRYGLNSFAVEWKIRASEYLLRFTEMHDRIAYYHCFAVQFHKLSFRNVYGFKVESSTWATRQFTQGASSNQVDEAARKEKLRAELAQKLKEYIKQAEIDHAAGKWPPKEIIRPKPAPRPMTPTAIEMDTARVDRTAERAELGDGEPVHELMSYEIAELPG